MTRNGCPWFPSMKSYTTGSVLLMLNFAEARRLLHLIVRFTFLRKSGQIGIGICLASNLLNVVKKLLRPCESPFLGHDIEAGTFSVDSPLWKKGAAGGMRVAAALIRRPGRA